MSDLESRLGRLEAINEIRSVVHRMTLLQDRPYDVRAVEYYTPDCIFETGSVGAFRGREEIRKFYEAGSSNVSFTLHFKYGGTFDVSAGNESAVGSWVSLETPILDADAVVGALRQRSHYKTEDGQWRVARVQQEILCMVSYEDGWQAGASKTSAWDPEK